MTDKYAVIGNPVAHSKSPLIHAAFAEQAGIDLTYERVLAPLDGFADTVQRLRDEGYQGCNVTVPFKFEAYQLSRLHSPSAQMAQAVNTLKFQPDGTFGANTDGHGLVTDIEANLGRDLQSKRVLLMGAGGAAYGVAFPLTQAGAALTIVNRNVSRAQALAYTMSRGVHAKAYSALEGAQFDIVINATSSGLNDELPPLPEGVFGQNCLAYDMMYGRETPFIRFAREQGATVADGLGMLVEQAAEAFRVWYKDAELDTAPVITQLRP